MKEYSPREKEIIALRNSGKTWKEVGASLEYPISASSAAYNYKRALKRVEGKE